MHTELIESALVPADRDSSPAAPAPMTRKLKVRAVPAAMPATVTVVIPCYNYARYLPAAVASALSQEGADVDVIVVDDRSTDGSLAVARELADADARVRVVAHGSNTGPVQTFNDGLAAARGEFLVRLDADDLLTPGSLRRALAVMQHFPGVGLVYGHPIHFIDGALPAYRDRATSWTVWPGPDWLAARCRSGYNAITSPEVLMRRCVVDGVGGQMPLAHTHDMEMWLRIAAFADVAYVHGADQAWHREHPQSLSAREVDSFRDLAERRDAFDTLFHGKAGGIAQAASLHAAARAALAAQAVELAVRQYDRGRPDRGEIGRLREMARSLAPDVEAVPGWAGLERRIAMGAARARHHPAHIAERVARGLRFRYSRWKWRRTGQW